MELLISEVIRSIKKITHQKVIQIKEYFEVIKNCKASYAELFDTGGIESTAEGERVIINLMTNVCGDILIFISPNEKNGFGGQDVLKLVQTDNQIEQKRKVAFQLLRQKHEGLVALPGLISILINFLLIIATVIITFQSIYELLHGNFSTDYIIKLWPWIFNLITFLFGKKIGFWLVSIFFK